MGHCLRGRAYFAFPNGVSVFSSFSPPLLPFPSSGFFLPKNTVRAHRIRWHQIVSRAKKGAMRYILNCIASAPSVISPARPPQFFNRTNDCISAAVFASHLDLENPLVLTAYNCSPCRIDNDPENTQSSFVLQTPWRESLAHHFLPFFDPSATNLLCAAERLPE